MPRKPDPADRVPDVTPQEMAKMQRRLDYMIANRRHHFIFTQLVWLTFFTGRAPCFDVAEAADAVRNLGRHTDAELADIDLHPLTDMLEEVGALDFPDRPPPRPRLPGINRPR